MSTSGGAGTLAADRCEDNGLVLPELAEGTQEKLARIVPDFGSCTNPVDVTAQLFQRDGRAFGDVCSIVCNDPATDALLVLVTMVTGEDAVNLAEDLAAAMAGVDVPCWVVWLAGRDHTARPREILAEAGIPVFSSIAAAARVAGMLAPPQRPALPPEPRPAVPVDRPGAGMASGDAGRTLLDAIGVARPRSALTHDPGEAVTAARELGGPLALKAVAPGLAHKMDAGAVRLGVPVDEVASVYADLVERVPGLDGVLVQQMAAGGLELLVGATAGRDGWPPVLTVGLGGTATEVHRDLATALAPVTFDEALAMLRSLRSWPLLAGHRGAPALDVSAAADVLVRVGQAISHRPELVELEINPLIVACEGALAADVLITVDQDR
ncbi:acetate--CoA ligase family protein [Pseudonocardia sp. DLS-67]